MTMKNTVASKDVMSGIILINSVNAYIPFDSGATYSFISHKFAHHLNLFPKDLEFPLNIL